MGENNKPEDLLVGLGAMLKTREHPTEFLAAPTVDRPICVNQAVCGATKNERGKREQGVREWGCHYLIQWSGRHVNGWVRGIQHAGDQV